MPDYEVEETGPTTQKTFTGRAGRRRSATARAGPAKKEAEQQAAEAACIDQRGLVPRAAVAERGRARRRTPTTAAATRLVVPELPEVETVRARPGAACGRAHHRRGRGGPSALRCAVTWPAATTSRPVLSGRRIDGGRPARQVPVAALDTGRRDHGPPRHERPAAGATDRPTAPAHLRVRFTFADGGLTCASSTSARSATWPSRRAARRCPGDRAHRPRPARPGLRPGRAGRGPRPAHRRQARAARPDARLRDRQHLRRRGAVAGPAALGAADRDPDPSRQVARAARGRHRGDARRPCAQGGTSFDACT